LTPAVYLIEEPLQERKRGPKEVQKKDEKNGKRSRTLLLLIKSGDRLLEKDRGERGVF